MRNIPKNKQQQLTQQGNKVVRFRMYKTGKLWVIAGTATLALLLGGVGASQVQAATSVTPATSSVTTVSANATPATDSASASTLPTSTAATTSTVSAATTATSTVASATPTSAASQASSTSDISQAATSAQTATTVSSTAATGADTAPATSTAASTTAEVTSAATPASSASAAPVASDQSQSKTYPTVDGGAVFNKALFNDTDVAVDTNPDDEAYLGNDTDKLVVVPTGEGETAKNALPSAGSATASTTTDINLVVVGSSVVQANKFGEDGKYLHVVLPKDLQVTVGGKATVISNLSVDVSQLYVISHLADSLDAALRAASAIVDGASWLTGLRTNFAAVEQQLQIGQQIKDLGQHTVTVDVQRFGSNNLLLDLSGIDGKAATIADEVNVLIDRLGAAAKTFTITGGFFGSATIASSLAHSVADPLINAAISLAKQMVSTKGEFMNQIASASFLGSTTVTIPLVVTTPQVKNKRAYTFGARFATVNLFDFTPGLSCPDVSYLYYENTQQGTIAPATYTIGQNTTITGAYTGDVTHANLYVNDQLISTGGTFTNGNFSYVVAPGIINSVNDIVELQALATDNTVLDTAQVNLDEVGTIAVNDYTINQDTTVTGSYTGNVKAVILLVNGTTVGNATAANGTYTITVANNTITNLTDKVVVVAYGTGATELDHEDVKLNKKTETGTVTGNTYTINQDQRITGSYTGDVKTIILLVNGTVVGPATMTDGNFAINVPVEKINTIKDLVILQAYGTDQTTPLDTAAVNLGMVYTGEIAAKIYTIGDHAITGSYAGNIKSAVLLINGVQVSTGGTFENGTFTYPVDVAIGLGDNVILQGLDANGTVIATTDIKAQPAVTESGFGTINCFNGSDVITGDYTDNYTGDMSYAIVYVNGEFLTIGGTFTRDEPDNPDNLHGTFSIPIDPLDLQAGDTITIEGYTATDELADSTTLQVTADGQTTTPIDTNTAVQA
ncbi:KxYKxGKxW signal peptide domain-containing protein [Loigolactobacillus binensis]|uniref:Immunoglobulin-like domain-containing protein n=1 Tax=Loigolactobacillus binensis TaxID=2559922 RepID=A0ABW3EBS6_9LACO|nr:KxYKxGKxW signal peptide domain-containing protein [Loigolactobacillus binensis]